MVITMKMTEKEVAKVTHDINNVWHTRFKGETKCTIVTHPNRPDSRAFEYHFINHGFDQYTFVGKYPL